jgi:hypothetical protein
LSQILHRLIWPVLFPLVVVSVSCFAQSEADLKRFFEGKRVVARIDMPASKDGIDIYPVRQPNPLDFKEYSARLKRNSVSVKAGDSIMVTLVRVKDKLIEFQLGGGGYGTLGDDTDTSVSVPTADKTRREKNLEDTVKNETDPKKKRRMQEELSDLKADRHREDARLRAMTAEASETKREVIRQKALQAGSRFNLRFQADYLKETQVTPESVMRMLAEYVDFSMMSESAPAPAVSSAMNEQRTAPRGPTALKKGMSRSEVIGMLGQPLKSQERSEGNLKVLTCNFQDDDNQIEADFIEDVLVRYRLSSK